MNIAFVILNYNIVEETVNCIKSIENNIDTDSYHIIVVDNGSGPTIREKLKAEKIMQSSHVTLLELDRNFGFAQGNNKGIEAARRFSDPPMFICCINNDTLLLQNNFYKVLLSEYELSGAAVIGPLIILNNDIPLCFNPGVKSLEQYQKELLSYKSSLNKKKNIIHLLKSIKPLRDSVRCLKKKIYNKKHWCDPMQKRENVILHGCCLIFTPIFFSKLKGFNPNTFLYREEELVYFAVQKNNLKTLYCPNLRIRHLEDVSTNSIPIGEEERSRLYIKNQIHSLEVLIAELKETTDL